MLVRDVIKGARQILSDVNASRWSDERLISLLNDALTDIAKKTILLIDHVFVELINEQVEYDLSDFAFKIVRIEYEDAELPAKSHGDLDRVSKTWSVTEGEKLRCWIFDKQKEANFKLYPVLKNSVIDNINFGGNFGIITGVTYSELQLNIAGTLGDLGPVEEDGFIKVFYTRKHPVVTELTDELLISSIAKEPIEHFIAGRALRDNQDTQNRTFGAEELQLYDIQIAEYSVEKAKNFMAASLTTNYNPGGA